MDFWITKKSIGKQGMFHYEVWTEDPLSNRTPLKIGERKSPRTYVACAGHGVEDGGHVIRNWFGRKDLIGKGESGRYLGKPGSFVALLKEENEEKPSRDTEQPKSGPDTGEGPRLE